MSAELFPAEINDELVQIILSNEAPGFESFDYFEDTEYINRRRILIGPVADIRHPEFGRENLPQENYFLSYRVKEEEHVGYDKDGVTFTKHLRHVIHEYIIDYRGDLIFFDEDY